MGTSIGSIATPQPKAEHTVNTTGTSIGKISTPQPKAEHTVNKTGIPSGSPASSSTAKMGTTAPKIAALPLMQLYDGSIILLI